MKVKDNDLKCLLITSTLFILSIFMNKYLFVFCTTIWILNIVWCMSSTLKKSNLTISNVVNSHNKNTEKLKENGKPISAFIFSLALPMCIIGCITVIILLISLLL